MENPRNYDEAEIVGLMHEIYHVLVQLGHYDDEDVAWPPAEGHALDLSRLTEDSRIDTRVLSLIRHIPHPGGRLLLAQEKMAPGLHPINYLDPVVLAESRDIDERRFDYVDMSNATPTVLLLMKGNDAHSPVVLDIADNTIREVGFEIDDEYTRNEPDLEKVKEYQNHYLKWPVHHAPQYLRDIIKRCKAGEWIPIKGVGVIPSLHRRWGPELRRILFEEYGWQSDGFREDDWRREARSMYKRLARS